VIDPLTDEIREQMRRFGVEGGVADLVEAWPRAVGEEIARHAWPARVQADGTLVVHVRDSIWGFELTQRAAEIGPRLPGAPKLAFVPGPLPEPAVPPPSPPAATLEEAREAAAWTAPIADAELREQVARAARASLAKAAANRHV
jgi:hypothetical protein